VSTVLARAVEPADRAATAGHRVTVVALLAVANGLIAAIQRQNFGRAARRAAVAPRRSYRRQTVGRSRPWETKELISVHLPRHGRTHEQEISTLEIR
jgi:hypothetical protein